MTETAVRLLIPEECALLLVDQQAGLAFGVGSIDRQTLLNNVAEGFEVYVVGDACGGLTPTSNDLALRRMEAAGARVTSWIQVLLELQRDWTRHATYDQARAIVEAHGGGYGIGLAYSRDMIHPA